MGSQTDYYIVGVVQRIMGIGGMKPNNVTFCTIRKAYNPHDCMDTFDVSRLSNGEVDMAFVLSHECAD